MLCYDSVIVGALARDTNVDFQGETVKSMGGAVLYSGYAAAGMGHRVAVVTRGAAKEEAEEAFRHARDVVVYPVPGGGRFVTTNVYMDEKRECRESTVESVCDPFVPANIPEIDASVWHMAGLARGDFSGEMIAFFGKKGKTALDVQCMLRCVEDGRFVFRDWEEKRKLLPCVDFLKTDAREAEILTGTRDREEAARILSAWGAKEILITHNEEVIAFDGTTIFKCPIRAGNLSGRTGRGDTTFGDYVCERLSLGVGESLEIATTLVSLKMETPGPFLGTREDVFYRMGCDKGR